MSSLIPAQLYLQSGERYSGLASAASLQQECHGEVIFNTGMVGYVESLTDPSYAGQLLCFTYPLIGNYGVSAQTTWESQKIQVKGVILSELAAFHTHYQAERSLQQWLDQQGIPYLLGVDTRALTHTLRGHGVVPGIITPYAQPQSEFVAFDAINWVEQVSIRTPECFGQGNKKIIVVDCGIKENILRCLQQFPIQIKRVPYDYDYSEEAFDGVFISNGPGDPLRCTKTVAVLRKVLALKKPCFGICLGTQLMALAAGAQTYKLAFGHRSQNQPCLHLPTQRCYLTSQNHGYAIAEQTLPNDWNILFRNLNDQSIAGIEHQTYPFFSVQFHPEAAPGPVDTQWLFQKFYELL